MKLVAVALIAVLAGACEDEKDNPAIAARKAECKQLEAHIFRISPEARAHLGGAEVSEAELSKRIDELVAKVPEEDIAQCASGDQAAITCMLGAPDIAAVRACIPALKQMSDLPDARDGLTRLERIILWQLREAQRERGDANVPTAMLYGRVVEHISVSVAEFQAVLQRLLGK